MEEFTITVTIADRIYRLTIERKEEEIVRKAARLIDEKMKEYAKSYAYKDKQDLLAMAALHFSTETLDKDLNYGLRSGEMEARLSVIDGMLNQALDKQDVL
jgi:cell division protein ZapA (FtsZ GTPase activity inhibitor)